MKIDKVFKCLALPVLIAIFTQFLGGGVARAAVIPIFNYLGCSNADEMNCILGISATYTDGRTEVGQLTGKANTWDSRDFEQNIRTYQAQEWRFPGLRNSSGTNTVVSQIWMQKPVKTSQGIDYGALDVTLFASLFDSPQEPLNQSLCNSMEVVSSCLTPPQFPKNVKFTITLISNALQPGLTSGSVSEAEFIQTPTAGGMIFTISGTAMEIPINLPDKFGTNPGQFNQSLDDRYYWHLYTLDSRNPNFNLGGSDSCKAANPIISSNAALASLPTYDVKTQEISLNVASPHLKKDGVNLEEGTFEARIPLKAIDCIWGVSERSLSERLQLNITYQDGASSVSTLNAGKRNDDFIIRADGYHYSSPTIHLKFLPPAAPAITTIKKKTIVCYRNKTIKNVSGLAPRCPSGFKLKKT